MRKQHVVISDNIAQALTTAIGECSCDRLFILVDETTERLCMPIVEALDCMNEAEKIVIKAGDTHKDIESISHVWAELQRMGATRHSLMINLGGGMVTDLGGFAAATFKRGIGFINIPTTLLAMVDASVGGKTGINFGGLKNEIGVFCNAHTVILDTVFLRTMDRTNILSGYAEMLKHGLISRESIWSELINYDFANSNMAELQRMVAESVAVKEQIVGDDPTEKGIRKALNLGHTIGHAFESLAMTRQPILHGYAVAYGLICELYLATVKEGFPTDKMHQTVRFIKEHYGKMDIGCNDYDALLELMTHDKKNTAGEINFSLLGGIGDIRINRTATRNDILEALDFYREC